MVLDLGKFVTHHPGGKFNLIQNVGRDISKYFYGGYSLENNLTATPVTKGHNHSNYARLIVNDLIVAVYDSSVVTKVTECFPDPKMNEMWNKCCGTVYVKSVSGEKVENFKDFYPGLEYIGRHFKVRAFNSLNIDAVDGKFKYEIKE